MRCHPALVLLAALASAGPLPAADNQWWGRDREGWFWYRDPPPDQNQPESEAPARPAPLSAFEAMQKRLDELKRTAVMEPSEPNLLAYMHYQRMVMDKSAHFAERWQKLVWRYPGLDYGTSGRPTNALAIGVFDEQQHRQRAQQISQISRSHALLFIFRGDCPHCHRFAPVLKRFAERYGLTVFPVSQDGQPLAQFPLAHADNGISRRLAPEVVPALYLSNPQSRQILPVGFGELSETDLEERISSLATAPQEASR